MNYKWFDESSIYACTGTRRFSYAVENYNGRPDYKQPYVEIIQSDKGIRDSEDHKTTAWCYAHGGMDWAPMEDVTTVEEAKALALVLWRMGE